MFADKKEFENHFKHTQQVEIKCRDSDDDARISEVLSIVDKQQKTINDLLRAQSSEQVKMQQLERALG